MPTMVTEARLTTIKAAKEHHGLPDEGWISAAQAAASRSLETTGLVSVEWVLAAGFALWLARPHMQLRPEPQLDTEFKQVCGLIGAAWLKLSFDEEAIQLEELCVLVKPEQRRYLMKARAENWLQSAACESGQ
jgi:hypothetical protein